MGKAQKLPSLVHQDTDAGPIWWTADLRVDGRAGQGQGGWVRQLGYFSKVTGVHWKKGSTMNRFLF